LVSFTPTLNLETVDRATNQSLLAGLWIDGLSHPVTGNMKKIDDFAFNTNESLDSKMNRDLSNVSNNDILARITGMITPLLDQLGQEIDDLEDDLLTEQDVIDIFHSLQFPITVNSVGGSASGFTAIPNPALQGQVVSVAAGTNPGFVFNGWTSSPAVTFATSANENTTFVMIGQPVTITANWVSAAVAFNVTVNRAGGGIITGSSANPTSATAGTTINVTAGTNPGFNFAGWTSSPAVAFVDVAQANTSFPMIGQNVTVTANWIEQTFGITVTRNGGTTNGTANPTNAAQGTTISISAGSNPGWTFNGWTSTPVVSFANAGATSTTFPMLSQEVTVTANWLQNFNVSMTRIGGIVNGTATPSNGVQGTSVSINANVAGNPGWNFSHWTASPAVIFANANNPTTTFPIPSGNVSITAHWIGAGPIFPPAIGDFLDNSLIVSMDTTSSDRFEIITTVELSGYVWEIELDALRRGPMFAVEILGTLPVDGNLHSFYIDTELILIGASFDSILPIHRITLSGDLNFYDFDWNLSRFKRIG